MFLYHLGNLNNNQKVKLTKLLTPPTGPLCTPIATKGRTTLELAVISPFQERPVSIEEFRDDVGQLFDQIG